MNNRDTRKVEKWVKERQNSCPFICWRKVVTIVSHRFAYTKNETNKNVYLSIVRLPKVNLYNLQINTFINN